MSYFGSVRPSPLPHPSMLLQCLSGLIKLPVARWLARPWSEQLPVSIRPSEPAVHKYQTTLLQTGDGCQADAQCS